MADPKGEWRTWGEGEGPDRRRQEGPTGAPGPLQDLEALAWLLDSSIQVPGTRFRIGVESLLGLIPVLGDALGALLSAYILVVSSKLGAPRVTQVRMAMNVALEALVGLVPVLGDLFDFAWKANRRNVELLKAHALDPARAHRRDWFFTVLLVLILLGLLFLCAWGAVALASALVRQFR